MDITRTIADLEQEKRKIDAAIASLKALANGSLAHARRGTIIEAAMAHIRLVGAPQTRQEIEKALLAQGYKTRSLRSLLSKRARDHKDIVHTGRGLWGVKVSSART